MSETTYITVTDEQGEARIRREAESCLGFSRVRLTLGAVMELSLLQSPYILGGEVTDNDICAAMDACYPDESDPMPKMPREEFHRELEGEIERAFGAYKLLDDTGLPKGRESDTPVCSPEWMCDIIGMAAQSLSGLTLKAALWEIPLATLIHLGLATARRNGAITRRDLGADEAIAKLLEMRRKAKEAGNG